MTTTTAPPDARAVATTDKPTTTPSASRAWALVQILARLEAERARLGDEGGTT